MAKTGRPRGRRLKPDVALRLEDLVPLMEQIKIASPQAKEFLAHAILRQHRLVQELGREVDRLAADNAAPSDRQTAAMTRAALALGMLLERAGLAEVVAIGDGDL